MRDFWNHKHSTNDSRWLTGSTLKEIKAYHGLTDDDFSDLLEIGVGTGSLRNELKKRGIPCRYTGCDIAPITDYVTEDLRKIRPVNLAIAHLVFQHCEPEEVERIINDVQLTKDGVFSFQVAVLRDKPYTVEPIFFTTVRDTKAIIKRSNKRLLTEPKLIAHKDFDWYVFKVGL